MVWFPAVRLVPWTPARGRHDAWVGVVNHSHHRIYVKATAVAPVGVALNWEWVGGEDETKPIEPHDFRGFTFDLHQIPEDDRAEGRPLRLQAHVRLGTDKVYSSKVLRVGQ
jgi:hypothetical protein